MNYSQPETMSKSELMEWARWNFNHWNDPKVMSPEMWKTEKDIGSSASWYILFLYYSREE